MTEMLPSTAKLVAALEAENSPRLKRMIKLAKEDYYNDFNSPLELPCHELVKDLIAYGFPALAERAMNGEFDGTKEESENWANSAEGMEVFSDETLLAEAKVRAKKLNKLAGVPWSEEKWQKMVNDKRMF